MKLHLGCGKKYLPGFYHIDALPYDHIDHVGRVDILHHIEKNSVKLIYACHVLEHFGRHEYKAVLNEWFRVLAPGGVLRIGVPDFKAVAEVYLNSGSSRGIEDVLGLCVGGQRDEYDFHKMVFDEALLTRDLIAVGFSTVRRWDWRNTEHRNMDDYSQSYLPHMDKKNGTLMSLNIESVK